MYLLDVYFVGRTQYQTDQKVISTFIRQQDLWYYSEDKKVKSIAIQCQPQTRNRVDQTNVKHTNQYTQVIVENIGYCISL